MFFPFIDLCFLFLAYLFGVVFLFFFLFLGDLSNTSIAFDSVSDDYLDWTSVMGIPNVKAKKLSDSKYTTHYTLLYLKSLPIRESPKMKK